MRDRSICNWLIALIQRQLIIWKLIEFLIWSRLKLTGWTGTTISYTCRTLIILRIFILWILWASTWLDRYSKSLKYRLIKMDCLSSQDSMQGILKIKDRLRIFLKLFWEIIRIIILIGSWIISLYMERLSLKTLNKQLLKRISRSQLIIKYWIWQKLEKLICFRITAPFKVMKEGKSLNNTLIKRTYLTFSE
jgi:hypothetical protein